MAQYDPYSLGQYDYNNYNQDPFSYDGYGFDSGNDPYNQTPPPAPDKDWADPVKVNREYLKKIQKSCILKGFEGLKTEELFLMEVLIERVTLKKTSIGDKDSTDKSDKEPFKPICSVKFFNFGFLEVNGDLNNGGTVISKSGSTDRSTNAFTKLFQEIFTTTERLVDESEEELGEAEEPEGGRDSATENNDVERANVNNKTAEEDRDPAEEKETFDVMKGKSVLIPGSGLFMIQKLQQHHLVVRVSRKSTTEEGETLGTCSVRLPGSFSRAVLLSCNEDGDLPCMRVSTGVHDLWDALGETLGTVEMTLSLTCFGGGVINRMVDGDYNQTFFLKHFKTKEIPGKDNVPYVDPRLALEVMKVGVLHPQERTSAEVLEDCVSKNLVPLCEEERRRALGGSDCEWFRMLDKLWPPPPVVSSRDFLEKLELERARLMMKQRQICRELERRGPSPRDSLDERLREVRTLRDTMEENASVSRKGTEDHESGRRTLTGEADVDTTNLTEELVRPERASEADQSKTKTSKKPKKGSNSKSKHTQRA